MTRAMMVAQFVRAQAWWRLDTPGVSAIRAARCVVALLDAAGCISGLPETRPELEELDRAGCFASGQFDPGPAGVAVVRGWELADEPTGATQDLLAALAVTVSAGRGVPSPAGRRAATASGAIPAAPLPSHPGPVIPEPAFAPDTVVFGSR
ncbi:MAG TPA: hypothetical protein VH089_06890 [Streptosporangiaceae bacterium]|nr:hypothetical protein [Streptosporangiaceae bacterium]